MIDFVKNFEPVCMKLKKFRNHVYEVCRFEDARSIQISSVFMISLRKLPIYQN